MSLRGKEIAWSSLLVAVGVAIGFPLGIAHERRPPGSLFSDGTESPRYGRLIVDSTPSDAVIWVNGAQVPLDNGRVARTPVEQLSNMQYGVQYVVQLRLEGYYPYTESLVMDEKTDGKRIYAMMKELPPRLTVEVVGDDARFVRVRNNGVDIGLGPKIEAMVEPGRQWITAELSEAICEAMPDKFRLERAESKQVWIRCRKPTPQVRRPAPPPPQLYTPASRPSQEGCGAALGFVGFVTITTAPWSEIYFEGKKLGDTPLAKQKLPSGCWEIRAVDPETKREKKVKIEVQPNRNLRYQFEL